MGSEFGAKAHLDKNAILFAGWWDLGSPKWVPFTLLVPAHEPNDGCMEGSLFCAGVAGLAAGRCLV